MSAILCKFVEAPPLRLFLDRDQYRRANPVEAIYAAFPAFLYLNPALAGSLLEPLLEFQSTSSLYSPVYAAPDLGMWPNFVSFYAKNLFSISGSSWPQVKGNNTDQSVYAVESGSSLFCPATFLTLKFLDCGSMLVMALAHARKSGDGSLIYRYYSLLRPWADYLVTNGLQPNARYCHVLQFLETRLTRCLAISLSSDNIAETSNLALKAIMGIYAMGTINRILEARGADPAKTAYYLVSFSSLNE